MEKPENEINERVKFKMREFRTALSNAAKNNQRMAIAFMDTPNKSIKASHYAEALQMVLEMLDKEIGMSVPYDEMFVNTQRESADMAKKGIMDLLHRHNLIRGRTNEHAISSGIFSTIRMAFNIN